jgi:putative tryptophan/tyrosine transport system substrate-binding protein
MRWREFTAALVGRATLAMSRIARAQPAQRVRRVAVLLAGGAENDQTTQARLAAFRDGLAKLGWVEDRNLRIELRFGGDDAGRIRAFAVELASLAPDVIVTSTAAATRVVQQQTQSIPIVITGVGDPVVSGIVKSLARPEACEASPPPKILRR